jgi:hypothetical protein
MRKIQAQAMCEMQMIDDSSPNCDVGLDDLWGLQEDN